MTMQSHEKYAGPMNSSISETIISIASADPVGLGAKWFAIHTRPRHEKKVAGQLAKRNITPFLPTLRETHDWTDRKKIVETPIFSCYVFVQVPRWEDAYYPVLRTPGVLQWVRCAQNEPTAIPNEQMDAIRSTLSARVALTRHDFVRVGQKVRLRTGSLAGVEGILVGRKGDRKLVLSINLIQQSLAVPIEGYELEPIY